MVGVLTTSDNDINNSFTYSLVSGTGSTDNASFSIVNGSLLSGTGFNFEAKNVYTIRVRSTDQGGLFTEKAFTINITDVPDMQGFVDTISPALLTGWAYDPSTPAASINVRVVIDSNVNYTVPTTFLRQDVNNAFNITGNHGFAFAIPGSYSTGYHQFDVYRLNPVSGAVEEKIGTKILSVAETAAPRGSFDGSLGSSIFGWAYDPDAPTTAINVRVDIDGITNSTFTTQFARADVNAAFGITGNHGFSFDIPGSVSNGSHTFAVYALDSTTGGATLLGSRIVVVNKAPVGYIDSISPTSLSGWAYDPDASATALNIRVDIDGVTASTFVTPFARADVNAVFSITGNHGFAYNIPSTLAAGTHTFNIYAVDSLTGAAQSIGTKTLTVSALPTGWVDSLNASTLSGWAYDPDAPSTSISVRIDIDGVTNTTITTTLLRADVNTAFSLTGNHGFFFALPTLSTGTHTVAIYGIDTVSSQAVLIGSIHQVIVA